MSFLDTIKNLGQSLEHKVVDAGEFVSDIFKRNNQQASPSPTKTSTSMIPTGGPTPSLPMSFPISRATVEEQTAKAKAEPKPLMQERVGHAVSGAFGQLLGSPIKAATSVITDKPVMPTSEVGKFFLGEEPIEPFFKGVQQRSQGKLGAVGALPFIAGTALDFVPAVGTEERAVAKGLDLAKSFKESELGKVLGEFHGASSPQTVSKESQLAADIVREAKGTIKNRADVEAFQSKAATDFFERAKPEANISNIGQYERTGKFADEPVKGYSEMYKKSTDDARETLQKVYGKDRVGYVDNYVRRQFQFASPQDEAKGTQYLYDKIHSLSASKSPTASRVLDMPLDEALQDMRSRGINVQPVTTNPEILRQWTVNNARQAESYSQAWKSLKDGNLISFVKPNGKPPEGMIPLDDRAAKAFFPSEAGMVQGGQYYANPDVVKILNNTIAKGLNSSPTYQGLRSIENTLNQFQLGLSGFHFTGTAINSSVSDLALGVQKLLKGNVSGAKDIGMSTVPFASFLNDAFKGNKFVKHLAKNDPEAMKFLQETLSPAGGRMLLDSRYRNDAYKKMVSAFSEGGAGGFMRGALRIPQAIVETAAKPLMEFAVPRAKLGAFMNLAENAVARLPADAPPELRRRALASAWDSIDNRFGQLVYDNLFWHTAQKDLSMLAVRSLGWNLGTIRELGGGMKDLAKGKLTDKAMYSISLPLLVGMYGGIYHYLHTGERPKSITDYFAPKDSSGKRILLPSYMKDVFSYSTSPVKTLLNKASPEISAVTELLQNKDWQGNMIRNPDDPVSVQLQQVGSDLLTRLTPFSVQQFKQQIQDKAPLGQRAESFFGVTRAPKYLVQTPAEKYLDSKRYKGPPLTPEQRDTANLKRQARTEIQSGKTDAIKELIKQGSIKNASDLKKFIRSSTISQKDVPIKNLGEKNGERAQYIFMELQGDDLTNDQKRELLVNLRKDKILTDTVINQLAELQAK